MENHWLYGSRISSSTSIRSRRSARSSRSARESRLRSRLQSRLSTRQNNDVIEIEEIQSPPRYDVTCKPHGLAVIIAVEYFNRDRDYKQSRQLRPRPGTQDEVAYLRRVFEDLNYTVLIYPDLTSCQLKMKSDMIGEKDHTSYDSFICCILSRGTGSHVYGSDGLPVKLYDFIGNFTGRRCPSLGGKPKLFFVESHPAPEVRTEHIKHISEFHGERIRVKFSGYDLDLKCDVTGSEPVVATATSPSDLDFIVASCVWRYRTKYPPLSSSFMVQIARAFERSNSKRDLLPVFRDVISAFQDDISESDATVLFKSTLRKELYLRTNSIRAKSVTFID